MTGRVCIAALNLGPEKKLGVESDLLTGAGWAFGDNALRGASRRLARRPGFRAKASDDVTLLVDPLDVRGIKRGIQALEADEAMRGALAARGLGQAEEFSAQAYQGRLAELYRRFT